MASLEEIEQNLKHCEAADLPDDMVGAAMLINPDGSQHAAIFLRYKGDSKLFHFTSKRVVIEDVSGLDDYYLKNLHFLPAILLPSFLAQCDLILDKAEPKYGYFYEGSLYDENGDFKSPGDSPQYMTCVGFCISVIKGFLSDEEFFEYTDWDASTLSDKMEYVEAFLKKVQEDNPNIDINSFIPNLRRITPIEYVAGAYSDSLPVRKAFTDAIVDDLQKILDKNKAA